ncbi:alpha-defensin 3-like [Peromyscus maniculatus bairdii]|uniref:alpha-defensin 3-like n=1 Tax=Peromyscus maniculatus bairdii TaxID=230844 RepID=UPI001C2E9475|nr:alpha-defensin 3-like isoform X2 [Peromyscus maniculatus bairdii]
MKTLVLLSSLVLLAYLAQADSIPEASEENKNEDQPGVEDQDVSISFGGPEGSALQEAGKKLLTCYCRRRSCKILERISGICTRGRKTYVFCCR